MNPHDRSQSQSDPTADDLARILAAYRECFSGESGQLILRHLESSVGYGRPSFVRPTGGNAFDPLAAAIRDGRKSVLDEIHDHLRTAADATPKSPKAVV